MSDKEVDDEEQRDLCALKCFRERRCQERREELFRGVCLGTHGWKELCARCAEVIMRFIATAS